MECFFRLLLGCPVEVLAGQRTAHGGRVGIVEHLQVSRDVFLHLLTVAVNDVALGQGLLGDRSLGHHADFLTEGGGAVDVLVGRLDALLVVGQESCDDIGVLLCVLGAHHGDAGEDR